MLTRPCHRRRKGAAVVELALVLPFLVSLLIGMFEISRGILVKEALSNATHRAARTASQPARSNTNVTADVDDALSGAGVSGYTTTIRVNGQVADVKTARKGDRVSVQVSVPVSKIYWVTSQFLTTSQSVSETVVMMRQG